MATAKPFIKWAGGKRQIINELICRLPKKYNSYHEPFLGGGALFFNVNPKKAYLSDINQELINVFKTIQNNVYPLINSLKSHKNTSEYFYYIRNLDRLSDFATMTDCEKASRFIFLNKTCFNGLYRVNKNGYFNVPFGKYKNPKIVDEDNLIKCNKVLSNADISVRGFETILNHVAKNDFVYFDPPYVPLSKTSNFTSYTKENFGPQQQEKLKNICDQLTNKEIYFMLSNSCSDIIYDLYKKYNIEEIDASRTINSNGKKRGKIKEIIVRNY